MSKISVKYLNDENKIKKPLNSRKKTMYNKIYIDLFYKISYSENTTNLL